MSKSNEWDKKEYGKKIRTGKYCSIIAIVLILSGMSIYRLINYDPNYYTDDSMLTLFIAIILSSLVIIPICIYKIREAKKHD